MTAKKSISEGRDLPEGFLRRLERIVPHPRLADVLHSFHEPAGVGFRVNTLRGGTGGLLPDLPVEAAALDWFPDGFVVPADQRGALLQSRSFADGRIWIQNPSSMLPPVILAPLPGDRVLDLAAAPGSKTLQLACMMGEEADIAAVEIVKPRFFRLKRNLKAQGASFVKTFNRDGMKVWRYRPDHFDRVLLDAPCSTEGRMRAGDPDTFRHWSERKVRTMAGKQRRLLESAIRCARPGGTVVYSTCSLAPEENEAVVQHALDTFGDAVRVDPIEMDLSQQTPALLEWDGTRFHQDVEGAVRVLPDSTYEAFFVCRLVRVG